jgi:hypothetical protein
LLYRHEKTWLRLHPFHQMGARYTHGGLQWPSQERAPWGGVPISFYLPWFVPSICHPYLPDSPGPANTLFLERMPGLVASDVADREPKWIVSRNLSVKEFPIHLF